MSTRIISLVGIPIPIFIFNRISTAISPGNLLIDEGTDTSSTSAVSLPFADILDSISFTSIFPGAEVEIGKKPFYTRWGISDLNDRVHGILSQYSDKACKQNLSHLS